MKRDRKLLGGFIPTFGFKSFVGEGIRLILEGN